MYRVIMVPTDGSGFDREAIRVALRLAEKTNAKICLVRVLGPGSFFGAAADAENLHGVSDLLHGVSDLLRGEHDNALSELYALAVECGSISSAEITVDLYTGPVNDVLPGYARRNDVDLIVISTHGRSGLARLSLGSVTDTLIRHTTIPVLVVKPPTSYLNPQVRKSFERIIVPLDGSVLAEQILPRVMALAKFEEAEITLLNVLTPQSYSQKEIVDPSMPWWENDVSTAQAYLSRIAAKLRCDGTPVTTDIVIGENIAQSIGEFANREKADLIAIATRGRGGLARILHGSVADAVLHSSRTSMLVFKPHHMAAMDAPSEDGIMADQIPG